MTPGFPFFLFQEDDVRPLPWIHLPGTPVAPAAPSEDRAPARLGAEARRRGLLALAALDGRSAAGERGRDFLVAYVSSLSRRTSRAIRPEALAPRPDPAFGGRIRRRNKRD